LPRVLMLYGTLAVPVPHGVAYPLIEAGWLSGIALMPGVHAHYLRYLCVADNAKARQALGFTPKRTTLENVVRTAKARRGRGRLVDFGKLEEIVKSADYKLKRSLGSVDAEGMRGSVAGTIVAA